MLLVRLQLPLVLVVQVEQEQAAKMLLMREQMVQIRFLIL
jgi:hypothetical protein